MPSSSPPYQRSGSRPALLLAVCLAPASVAAQPGPIGPDVLVTTEGSLACPTVAMSAQGDFEVVWNHYYSDSHPIPQGMFARHFDRLGRPTQPAAIRLDLPRSIDLSYRRIVALPGAGYFVVWWEYRGGSRSAMVGRFLDSAGRPRSPVLLLKRQALPVALALVSNKLLVAWREDPEGPVWARRFDLAGQALGKAMLLTKHEHLSVFDLAPLKDSFVAVWERWTGTSWAVEAQRFSPVGNPLGAALRLNDNPPGGQFGVRVASNGNDRYAVAWTKRTQTGPQAFDEEPRVRFFGPGGARGPATNPSQPSPGAQHASGVAMDSNGSALVTWVSWNSATAEGMGRFLDPTGQPAGQAFSLAQDLADGSHFPAFCPDVATSGNGDAWIATWLHQNTGIFARRLAFEAE